MRKRLEKNRTESINAEAAEWLIRLRDENPDYYTRAQFAAWLLRFPAHLQAYLEMSDLWNDAGKLEIGRDTDLDALIVQARQDDDVVVPLSDWAYQNRSTPDRGEPGRAPARPWLKIASAFLVAGVAVLFFLVDGTGYFSSREYRTETGEQLSFSLNDGSVVYLNTKSRLVVEKFDGARRVVLLEGEAFFDVAPDPARPFLVSSDAAVIRVLGTKFNVQKLANETTITVTEGKVTARRLDERGLGRAGASEAAAVELVRGEQATVHRDAAAIDRRVVDIKTVTAWRERRLLFDSQPLQNVVAAFNRYDHRQIQIGDRALLRIRISGVFDADGSDSFIDYLKKYEGVVVQVDKDGKRRLLLAQTDDSSLQ